jgi:hypothetical protein
MKRTDARLLLGIGSLFVAGAVALLSVVGVALRSGTLDARTKHAPVSKPEWLLAAQEPFWFYGIIALVTAFAAYLLVQGWRMIREARSQR